MSSKITHVLLIEDEVPAADQLSRYLSQYDPQIHIFGPLPSVAQAVKWLQATPPAFQLVFMDVQLADGLCFDIFSQQPIEQPIIFTTAYDEYALQAFQHHSISYLLKPISFAALKKSMHKLQRMKSLLSSPPPLPLYQQLNDIVHRYSSPYKSRFMLKVGEHIKSIPIGDISCFYAEGRNLFLCSRQGRRYIIDYTLGELTEMLDPSVFFRVNRSFMLHIEAIRDVIVYSNSRLKIQLAPKPDKEIIVSREKVQAFKLWLGGEATSS